MAFNPLTERGIPLDKQLRNWSELNSQPYDKYRVDPYTRCRIITMNGIEVESIFFSHQFSRHTDHPEIKKYLAITRRIEQQQQKAVNWMIPWDETNVEVTLGYEQVAIDLTAYLARTEPDPYLKQTMEFGLLEDFDHLYHSFMTHESDPRVRALWELHLNMELEHLRQACDMMRRYEGIEPEEILPQALPDPLRFESNKDYIRQVLASQVDLRTVGTEFVPLERLPQDSLYFEYQRAVHGDGPVPSEQVIEEHIRAKGTEYRLETEGPHPVESLRRRA